MRRLFKVGADRHDSGKVTFSWHPEGNFLATAGRNGSAYIYLYITVYDIQIYLMMIKMCVSIRNHTYYRSSW